MVVEDEALDDEWDVSRRELDALLYGLARRRAGSEGVPATSRGRMEVPTQPFPRGADMTTPTTEELAERLEQLRAIVIADACVLRCLLATATNAQLAAASRAFDELSEDVSVKLLFSRTRDGTNHALEERIGFWRDETERVAKARVTASRSIPPEQAG